VTASGDNTVREAGNGTPQTAASAVQVAVNDATSTPTTTETEA
jgi:hypothetical protein